MVPLLSYFLAYLGGILTSLPPSRHFLFPYLLSSVITLSGFVLYTQAKKCRRVEWLLLPALFYCGWMSPGLSAPAQPDNHIWHYLNESARARVEGQVVEPPQVFQDKVAYLLQLSKIKYKGEKPVSVSGRARITLYVPVNRFHQGDLLVFNKVRLKRPRNFKNPGRFDYKRYMESLGIDVTGGVSKIASIEKAGARPLPFFTALRGDIRERNLAMIDKNLAPAEGGLLKGMVLGERHSLSDEVREAYYATGLAHLMAVSGLHIGFVAAAFGFVLYPLMFYFLSKYFPRATRAGYARKITVLLTFLPVMFYMFVIGDKISALRAGIMVMLVLTAILVNRTKNLFNALLIAAFLILVWKPQSILDVSFQLSFAAVLSILIAIYFFGKQQGDAVDRMGEIHWTRRLPRILILISLAAFLGTLPILIFHFHRISLVGFFLNLLMVPIASIVIPFALFTLVLGLIWQPLASVFLPVVSLFMKLFIAVPTIVASMPYASVYVAKPPGFWFPLYYLVLFAAPLMVHYYRSKKSDPQGEPLGRWFHPAKYALGLAAVGVVVWFLFPRFPLLKSDKLSIYIADVGQGESIFIEFPNRETLLLDGGGFYKASLDVGKLVVAPFIWERGIRRIDYLGATHSDNDHIHGLESIMKIFPVKNFLDRGKDIKDFRLKNLRRQAVSKNVAMIPLKVGLPLEVGDVRLIPIHPDAEFREQSRLKGKKQIDNNLSLVLRVEYRDFSMLLTGDIEEKAEQYLVGTKAPLRAKYLKAPHHGSRRSNSPAFAEAVRPRTVIFSSGHRNFFNHPHPEAVDVYKTLGAQIWRTDQNGGILITTDGFKHTVQTHAGL